MLEKINDISKILEKKLNFVSNYKITLIKILAIIFSNALFFICAIFITLWHDRYIFKSKKMKTDKEYLEKKSLWVLIGETVYILSILSINYYIFKNLLQAIPFPLDGVANFEYMRVKEVSGAGIIFTALVVFSETLQIKYQQLKIKLKMLYP